MIIPGDALSVLKRIKSNSIHMGVTSPPYHGLRKYGTNPVVWEGDPNCEHDWNEVHPSGYRGSDTNPGPMQHEGNKNRENLTSDICSRCGAWRGELGLEPTPALYIAHLTEIFHELKRVLRQDGVFFLNIGDSYARNPKKGGSGTPTDKNGRGENYPGTKNYGDDMKEKDLIEIPSLLAQSLRAPYLKCNGCGNVAHYNEWGHFPNGRMICPKCELSKGNAVAEEGWYLRSRLTWVKRNSLPSSVEDRPGSSIEYIFILTKSGDTQYWTHAHDNFNPIRLHPDPDYIYTNRKTKEIVTIPPENWKILTFVNEECKREKLWKRRNLWEGHDYYYDYVGVFQLSSESYNKDKRPRNVIRQCVNKKSKFPSEGQFKKQNLTGNATYTGFNDRYVDNGLGTRYMRDSDFFFKTWQGLLQNEDGEPIALIVNPKPYKGAHFAVFSPRLIEPLIIAGSSEKVCPQCGAPWVRTGRKHFVPQQDVSEEKGLRGAGDQKPLNELDGRDGFPRGTTGFITTGWKPSCDCNQEFSVPSTILDPFSGSGATGVACKWYNRRYIGIELNPNYVKLSEQRIAEGK